MKKRLTFLLVLLFIGNALFAQNSTQGKEFWLSFMRNGYQYNGTNWVETQVMVSAKRACSGTISNPRTSWSMTFEVGNESVVVLQIPLDEGYNTNNEGYPSNFGLELTATDTISVYTANCATNSFDATFVLPVESLGSDYIVQCDSQSKTQSSFGDQETSAFLIVATEDNTQIDIIPSETTLDGHSAGTTYSVSLDKGQTYFMRSNNSSSSRDFSGTKISARDSKKIAVFNGNTLTTIPNFISWVLVYAIAICIFSTDGFVNSFLTNVLHQTGANTNYLQIADHTWLKMLLWGTWKGVGWSAIVYIAGIAGIDQQLYEAARVDGANRFRCIWHITIPGLVPTYMVMLLMSIAGILSNGMEQYLVFENAMNKDVIEVLDLYVYHIGIGQNQIPLSTVVGISKSLIGVTLLFAANGISRAIRGESII